MISKTLGHCFPVTKRRSRLASYAMPFSTDSCVDLLIVRQQAGEIDPGNHVSVVRIDACDPVRVPDIGVNLTLNKLQLVQLVDDRVPILHQDVVGFFEAIRVAKAKRRRAIAGDELFGGARHAPALTAVIELLNRPKAEAVINKADLRLPRPLVDVRPPIDDPLSKILRRQRELLQRFPGFRLDGK